jgi:hypothetical protein
MIQSGSSSTLIKFRMPTKAGSPAGTIKRASEREPGPEDFDRIEGEFRIEAALNVAGLPEAMLLAREQEIADRIAPPV